MGYRAGIYVDGVFINELPKFYGYLSLDTLKNLPSIHWLISHHKIDVYLEELFDELDEVFASYSCPEIEFTADEFRDFMDFYVIDFSIYGLNIWVEYPKGYNLLKEKPWLKELYDNNLNKTIMWR